MPLTKSALVVNGPVGDDLFRLMVECVTDYAIFMLDPAGRVSTWNAGARRLKGWEADEIIGRHFSAFYPAEDVVAGKPDRELVEAAAVGRFEDEGWRLRKDGSRFWANVIITALRDRDGVLRGFGKVTRDLAARKEAEEAQRRAAADRARAEEQARAAEAVRQSEEQFRSLADSIAQLVWMTDAQGEVSWFNRRWYEYTGLTFDDTQGWGWRGVVDPADLPRVLGAWQEALAAGLPWEDELRLRRRDGVYRWHLARSLPVRDAQGRVTRWFGTSTDIEE
jgi:PAS domain S-box-containing protein